MEVNKNGVPNELNSEFAKGKVNVTPIRPRKPLAGQKSLPLDETMTAEVNQLPPSQQKKNRRRNRPHVD